MKQQKHVIFPTEIWVFDNVLLDNQIESVVEAVYNEKVKHKVERTVSQSRPDLINSDVYRPLVDKAVECSKIYTEDKKWEYEGFKITGMWSNIQKTGQNFHPHTHSNNLISGVYYAKSDNDKTTDIVFSDPRPQANVLKPWNTKFIESNSDLWYYPSLQNRMILFPSWLSHYVPENKSTEDRISIAFNVMLTGQVGRPEDFQTANF
tara:strand:+ start:48 stop:665 length:618 start_codon:yes stop_codon:yes gene_type:complete